MTFYVMKRDPANVGGFSRLTTADHRHEAERLARSLDTKINGRPGKFTQVWDEQRYDEWHKDNIMPYYR